MIRRANPRAADGALRTFRTEKGSQVKTFVTVIVTVLVTVGVLTGVGVVVGVKQAKAKQSATKVRMESPERGDLVEVASAAGVIEPSTKVSISARVSARIEALPFREGDTVTKGGGGGPASVLVQLDATEMEAALRSVQARRAARAAETGVAEAEIAAEKARIEKVRVSLEQAARDLARQEALLRAEGVSEATYDAAKCKVDELSADMKAAVHSVKGKELKLSVIAHELEAADAEIAQARDKLSYTTITSPIDGIVTKLNAEVGELVVTGTMNNPGTVIMEVADLSRMVVVAAVNESDVGAIEEGQRAHMRVRAYPDREFFGRVRAIALTGTGAGNQSRDFRVEILLDTEGEKMYSGSTADVDIETRRHEGVLRIPSQAVVGRRVDDLPSQIADGNENVDKKKTFATVVYRAVDGKAVATPVKVGASDATHTVIRAGLSENDRVIVGPYKELEKLKHDQRVEDERESDAAQSQPSAGPQPSATQEAGAAK